MPYLVGKYVYVSTLTLAVVGSIVLPGFPSLHMFACLSHSCEGYLRSCGQGFLDLPPDGWNMALELKWFKWFWNNYPPLWIPGTEGVRLLRLLVRLSQFSSFDLIKQWIGNICCFYVLLLCVMIEWSAGVHLRKVTTPDSDVIWPELPSQWLIKQSHW